MKYIISFILIISTFFSCTRNDGNIGPWFGMWRIERIIKNEIEESINDKYICYQSQVVCLRLIKENHEYEECYGLYEIRNDKIAFTLEEGKMYIAEEFLFFNPETILDIEKITVKELILSYEGVRWKLKKF